MRTVSRQLIMAHDDTDRIRRAVIKGLPASSAIAAMATQTPARPYFRHRQHSRELPVAADRAMSCIQSRCAGHRVVAQAERGPACPSPPGDGSGRMADMTLPALPEESFQ